MNIEIETLTPSRSKIICTVTPEEAASESDKAVKKYMATGTIPGFRKGKAPRQAIAKQFAKEISEETIRTTVNEYYKKAVEERNLKVFEIVDIDEVKRTEDGGVSFVATVDLEPEFELPKYEGIPVDNTDTEVTDEAVEKELEAFRKSMAKFEDFAADTVAVADDMLCISYAGSVDGKPMAETYPELAQYGAKDTSWCTVGSQYYILPGMTEQLVGRKIGEEFAAAITFPEDFHKEELRGVVAEYKVTVKEGRHLAVPEIDAEFLKPLRAESVDALKQRIREHLEMNAKAQDRDRRLRQITDYLVKSTPFELPQAELERNTQESLSRILNYGMRSGSSKEELEKDRENLMKIARETADNRIRSALVIGKIGQELGTKLSGDDFNAYLNRTFQRERLPEAQIKQITQDTDRMRQLYSDALREKILEAVLEKATPSEVIG